MRVLVATGCTSGLGSIALSQFLSRLISNSQSQSQSWLILAGYRSTHPPRLETFNKTVELKWLQLDLANFESVNQFAHMVKQELHSRGLNKVDTLLLNAAVWKAQFEPVQLGEKQYSKEALVKHFAQYYLTQELLPLLSATPSSEERSRIIFTTSSLQNSVQSLDDLLPLLTSSLTPQTSSKARYAASKLLQTISYHSLHQQLTSNNPSSSSSAKDHGVVDIVSVSPGFVPTTGLARETSWWQRLFMRYIISWAPFCTSEEEGAKRIVDCITLPIAELESNPSLSSDSSDSTTSRFLFQPSQDSSNNASLNQLLAQLKGGEEEGAKKEWEELKKVWMPSLKEMRSWAENREVTE
ncbi:hypothetical protein JCM5353_005498 [Sporobolomyces roseus]